jgi:hypothetical protein
MSTEDVSDDIVYNYDETNLQDNLGAVKASFHNGVKYADQSKSSISMTCGNRKVLLPPFILFKGSNMYELRCVGGLDKPEYGSLHSSWFHMRVFGGPDKAVQ